MPQSAQRHEAPSLAMTPCAAPEDPLHARNRRIWSAGAYERIAAGFRHEAEIFIDRLELSSSDQVLDAACGTGNLTLPAAETGARVHGIDLVPELLQVARERAQREHLEIELHEGSVEALPFADESFDVVTSMFGVAFAARPERVVDELGRVVKPGGVVALANWTATGFAGRMLALHANAVPPPAGVASPLRWGGEDAIHELFDADRWRLEMRRRTLTFRFPHTPRGTAELFRAAYGPTVVAMAALDEDGRAELHGALTEHWVKWDRRAGRGAFTEVESEYLEVWASRR